MLLAILVPSFILRSIGSAQRHHLRALLPIPVIVVSVILAGIAWDDHRAMLALPVVMSAAMLVTFVTSLFGEMPIIERFARLQNPDLPQEHLPYIRAVTIAWCGFFVLNGGLCVGLALWASLEAWALYVGLIAYVVIGALFVIEYVIRKYLFRDYGAGLHDRVISAVFPPHEVSE